MSTRLSDYDYQLPAELIADRPASQREESRMLVLDRSSQSITHRKFKELPNLLPADTLAVLNNTKVIPARVFDEKNAIEALLMNQLSELQWRALVKPGRKMKLGSTAKFAGAKATVIGIEDDGARVLEFSVPPDLERFGVMPLPPYIRRASDADDKVRYQTVYASVPGAVAAPTAGLHFTPELLAQIPHAFITLHVGAGTFKPVQVEQITEHTMHEERFEIGQSAADAINASKRILAIGTTTVRVLESAAELDGKVSAMTSSTSIFIRPLHSFRRTDHLLTNFHLPKSTLLMLVSAFADREFILEAYREAIAQRYRFFSYGDCMLIL